MRRLLFKNFQSPGDILMLSAALRDLHLSHPGKFQTDVRTPCAALWENNPYLSPLDENDGNVEIIECAYPLVHQSNSLPYHFIHGFRLFLQEKLGAPIRPHAFKGDIHLSREEKSWMSQSSFLLVGIPVFLRLPRFRAIRFTARRNIPVRPTKFFRGM